MSCCKSKYVRYKDITLVKILAEQYSTINNEEIALLKLKHGVYGEYYDFIPKKETQNIKSPYYGKPILYEFGGSQLKKVSKSMGKKRSH